MAKSSVDKKTKKKKTKDTEAKTKTVRNGGLAQINIWVKPEDRDAFRLLCNIRGWTNGEGFSNVINFIHDVREDPKSARSLIEKYGLAKVSE